MVSVALIGGSGFIGSHLARFLVSCTGYDVHCFDLGDDKLRLRFENNDYSFERLDVRNSPSELDRVIAETDVVVNLAAHVKPGIFLLRPLEVVEVNFFPSISIIESWYDTENSFYIFPQARFTARPAATPTPSKRTIQIVY